MKVEEEDFADYLYQTDSEENEDELWIDEMDQVMDQVVMDQIMDQVVMDQGVMDQVIMDQVVMDQVVMNLVMDQVISFWI